MRPTSATSPATSPSRAPNARARTSVVNALAPPAGRRRAASAAAARTASGSSPARAASTAARRGPCASPSLNRAMAARSSAAAPGRSVAGAGGVRKVPSCSTCSTADRVPKQIVSSMPACSAPDRSARAEAALRTRAAAAAPAAGGPRPNTSSSGGAKGIGVSSPPTRLTGASSHSNASWPIVAAISPPKPPVSGASCSDQRAVRLPHRVEHRLAVPGGKRAQVDHLDVVALGGQRLGRRRAPSRRRRRRSRRSRPRPRGRSAARPIGIV